MAPSISNVGGSTAPSGTGQLKLDPAPVHHYFDNSFIDQVRRRFLKQFCSFTDDDDIDSGIDIGIDGTNSYETTTATVVNASTTTTTTNTTTTTANATTTNTKQQQQQQQQQNNNHKSKKDSDKINCDKRVDNDDNDDDDDNGDDRGGTESDDSDYFDSDNNKQDRLLKSDYGSDEFDPIDIEQIKSGNDWFLRRFLVWKPTTVDEAVKAIHQALVWRKQININSWKDTDFPAEFYQIGACFSYLPDRENQNVLILRLRCNKRDSTGLACVEQLVRNYFIYVLEKVVTNNPNRGFALIFDCHKASLANVDLDLARFVINTLSCFYPGAISYICIYDLPWIFNQIWRLIRSWLDDDARRIVKFATKSNITDLIAEENLPEYMGGLGRKDFRFLPKGIQTIEELAPSIGITSQKDIHKLSEHFQKLIKIK